MSTTKRSSYRWAVRAYPLEYREAFGHELVGTANDLTGGRWSLRQSTALLAGGLRTRERLNTGGDQLKSAAQGFGIALAISFLAVGLLTGQLAAGADGSFDGSFEPVGIPFGPFSVLALTMAAALTRSTRRPTLVVIALINIGIAVWIGITVSPPIGQLLPLELLGLWFIDRFGDGRRVLSPKFALLVGGAVVVLALAFGDPAISGLAFLAFATAGLALIRLRPTWALGTAFFVATTFGVPDLSLAGVAVSAAVLSVAGFIALIAIRSAQTLHQP